MAPIWGESESSALIWMLLIHITGFSKAALLVSRSPLRLDHWQFLEEAVQKLEKHEPIQYILGKAPFLDFEVFVNQNVLIPRPETEELVGWILENKKQPGGKVIDFCTGSGCIAMGLSRSAKWTESFGLDVSKGALDLARKSSECLDLKTEWLEADLLHPDFELTTDDWDLMVANPPYVLPSERLEMSVHVLEFEPELALFVPADDAIIFYKIIAGVGMKSLKPGGWLYFELNPDTGTEVAQFLAEIGFVETEFRQDMQGKTRMLRGRKPD